MERLTSNKPVDEMSMVELAHNSCYAENHKAMYRDFETIRDARDFARELYEAYVNEKLPTDDDEFDGRMIDDLQYEPTIHANGLIALFYRNLWAMADLREQLKKYEDAEEKGLMLRLGSKDDKDRLIEVLATKLFQSEFGRCYMCTNSMKNITLDGVNNGCDGGCNTSEKFTIDDFLKKIVRELEYTKRKEVEQALEEMKGE